MNYEFLTRLGGDPATIDPYTVNSANYSFSRHIVHTAASGDCAGDLAAILPCPCSYNEFARTMVLDMSDAPIWAEWIRRFGSDPENDELLASLTGLFDRLVDVSDA